MKKESNKLLIIAICTISIFLIVSITLVILYQTTDFGKSKDTLFTKYIYQNLEHFDNALDFSAENDYISKISNDSFKEQSVLTLQVGEENYKFDIDLNNNKTNNKLYGNIDISCNQNELINMEILKKENVYGIRIVDIINQFIAIKNENLDEFEESLGIANIDSANLISKINLNDYVDIFNFTEEEKNQLIQKYYNLSIKGFTKDNYSANRRKTITLNNGTAVDTKTYTVSFDQNELNNIEKRVLNSLLEEEIIINKLQEIDSKMIESGIENVSVLEMYKNSINNQLDNYGYTTQGENNYKITVYVCKGNTVRTLLEYNNTKISIDLIENTIMSKYSKIENNEEKIETFNLKNEKIDNGYNMEFIYNNNDINEITINRKIQNNNINTNVSYNSNTEKVFNLSLNQNLNFETSEPTINDENKIAILNNYSGTDIIKIIKALKSKLDEYINNKQGENKVAGIETVLNLLNEKINNLEQLQQSSENFEITKFNSQFELYKGDNVESSIVLELINTATKNMKEYKTASNQVRLYIENGTDNSEKNEEIKALINTKLTYIVSLGYDENGLIETITLIPNEKK